MGCYTRLVVRYPYVLIIVDIVLVCVCGPVTVWYYGLPDFSDPIEGFEPRGTSIRGWSQAAEFLDDNISNGNFSSNPDYTPSDDFYPVPGSQRQKRNADDAEENIVCADYSLWQMRYLRDYPRMILKTKDGSNMMQANVMKDICSFEEKYIQSYWPDKTSCYSYSLPLYISALTNKTCETLDDEDINTAMDIIIKCTPFYFNGSLTPTFQNDFNETTNSVLDECTAHNAVYIILHTLSDNGFMEDGDITKTDLTLTLLSIPSDLYGTDDDIVEYFDSKLDGNTLESGNIISDAYQLTIQFLIFGKYIVSDLPLYGIAMGLVIILLLLYLQSFVLMLTVVLNVIFTFSISYFLYFFVCRFVYFPFMNLLAGLLLIAVSADDVFILYDIWRQQLHKNPDCSLEQAMSETLRHGVTSIMVTSLTTAAALMSNLVSDITAIRCFGVFSGLCMIVTFGLMITWVPACIVLIEKATRCCCPAACSKCRNCCSRMTEASEYFWGKVVLNIVSKAWPLWIIVFLFLGVGGLVVIFWKPGLNLPTSQEVTLFAPNHPFTKYGRLNDMFRFENTDDASRRLDFQVIWGMKGIDNGRHLDPNDVGHLVLQPFDIYSEESQQWMKGFCPSLMNQTFVNSKSGYICYMDLFKELVEKPCSTDNETIALDPCCGLTFPLDAAMAEQCMRLYASISYGDLSYLMDSPLSVIGKPIYGAGGQMKFFANSFYSNTQWTPVYSVIDNLYNDLDEFVSNSLASAPDSLNNGWFSGQYGYELGFYDLQKSLANGTMLGIAISLAAAFLVLLITSLNVVITIYAIFTITFVIAAIVGSLVLIGWELNIIESLTITLSIGLSVDFTIHYGVAYKLSTETTRKGKVKNSLVTVGSAVTMAALTTFVTGAAVVPGRVASYRQFGIFLMIVMMFSWFFATLFFLAVCNIIGPLGHTGDLLYLFRQCCKKKKTQNAMDNQQNHTDADFENFNNISSMKM